MFNATKKERFVTRTITSVKYEVLQLNIETKEVSQEWYTLVGDMLPEVKAMERLKECYETDTIKIVSLTNTEVVTELYALDETIFMEMGHVITR